MTYLEWNEAIGNHFFKPEYTERFIYLYIDRETVISLDGIKGKFDSKDKAWDDFLLAIKKGLPGAPIGDDLLKKALHAYECWKIRPIQDNETIVTHPFYLVYLTLFVLPLTDSIYSSGRSSDYYPRFEKFSQIWSLPKLNYQNPGYNWNLLWKDLQEWSFQDQNMDLGIFEIREYKNKAWVYVGKALAQCLLSLRALQRLGVFFYSSGLSPGENINRHKIRQLLLSNGKTELELKPDVMNSLRSDGDEKGETVIDIVHQEYNKWEGDTDFFENSWIKGWTIARIHSILEIDDGLVDSVDFKYKIFSLHDFPEDLCFGDLTCTKRIGNWSSNLELKGSYYESLELEDRYNKWKARLPKKDIRIFISGSRYNLKNWVEVDFVFPDLEMYLLVKSTLEEEVMKWNPKPELLKKVDGYEGIPAGFIVFHLKKPVKSHSSLEGLIIKSDYFIELIGGLKVGRRTWLNVLLPDVFIEGINKDSVAFIEFKDTEEKIILDKDESLYSLWRIPENLRVNENFYIKIEGKKIKGDHLPYRLVNYKTFPGYISGDHLPKRNEFGELVNIDIESCVIGSHAVGINYLAQGAYVPHFFPIFQSSDKPKFSTEYLCNEFLIYYLTQNKEITAKEFYNTFEFILSVSKIDLEKLEKKSISNLKRTSLQLFDYLGYIDYEYGSRKIKICPPQIIFIPSESGYKLLLIGGRTPALIELIAKKAKEYDFKLMITPQDTSNLFYLLPQRIIIWFENFNRLNDIKKFAQDCNLIFKTNTNGSYGVEFSQFGLLNFSGDKDQCVSQIKADTHPPGEGWICRKFNQKKLCFEKTLENDIDKSFQLVEYKVNEYTYLHRLWKDDESYPINKNWGRYLVLDHYDINVTFYDSDKKILAVPATVPLPRLLIKGIILCSGLAPIESCWMKIKSVETYWHFFQNVPYILIKNEFKKIGQNLTITVINF